MPCRWCGRMWAWYHFEWYGNLVIMVSMAVEIVMAMVMAAVQLLLRFATEHQFIHPFMPQRDTSKDLLRVYRWHEKVKLAVTTLSLRAGCCAADGARGKAGSFPTSHEVGDMSNAPNHPESLVIDGKQVGYAKLFHRDFYIYIYIYIRI